MDTQTQEWLEGQYLKAGNVQDNDIIEIVEQIGLVDNSFGKKKFEFKILWNGKEKILSCNAKQFQQIKSVEGANKFSVGKKVWGNTFVMDFKPLVAEKVA